MRTIEELINLVNEWAKEKGIHEKGNFFTQIMKTYEEVGEISHRISEGGLWLDDYYLFHETLKNYRNKQSKDKQEELERVLRNERFRGRQRVLRDLRIVFKEFDIRTN